MAQQTEHSEQTRFPSVSFDDIGLEHLLFNAVCNTVMPLIVFL